MCVCVLCSICSVLTFRHTLNQTSKTDPRFCFNFLEPNLIELTFYPNGKLETVQNLWFGLRADVWLCSKLNKYLDPRKHLKGLNNCDAYLTTPIYGLSALDVVLPSSTWTLIAYMLFQLQLSAVSVSVSKSHDCLRNMTDTVV